MKVSPLTSEELGLFRTRLMLVLGAFVLVLAVLVLRLWFLQIVERSYYDEVARGNRIRVVPQEGPRGIIYDRNGEILAYNRPAFNVQLILEDTPDLERSLRNLATVTDVPVEHFRQTVAAKRSGPKFKPIVLLKDIGRSTAALIETYQESLPGITVAVESKRLYPGANVASHVLGYVGVINEEQLSDLSLNRLYSGRIVGQAGIELVRNEDLIGVDGGRQVEVDHVGRELRVLSKPVDPIPGSEIYLTLDLKLQRYVRKLLADKSGVVIVSKPRTGEVLSMVSMPDYDPNVFVSAARDDAWAALTGDDARPLVNKAISGQYPPGSTFKLVVASAGLDQGVIDEETTLNCPGYYRVGRDIRYCWKRSGHGDLAIREAIEQSCNVFFYQLGMQLGVDTIRQYALQFGLGQPTGIELEGEKSGLIPSRAWKEETTGEPWYDGETVPVAIGQGFVNVTPIQLANYLNTIANGGLWVQPTVVRRVVTPEGVEVLGPERLPRNTRLLPFPVEVFDVIREGMVQAVNKPGTAGRARSRHFTVAGKTGTSQVVGRKATQGMEEDEIADDLLPHSLFIGYAPAEDPQVTVMVLVEHGGSGGREAAPIARKILEYYNKHIQKLESRFPDVRMAGPGAEPSTPRAAFRHRLDEAFATPPGAVVVQQHDGKQPAGQETLTP